MIVRIPGNAVKIAVGMIFRCTRKILESKAVLDCNQQDPLRLEQPFDILKKRLARLIPIGNARCLLKHAVEHDVIKLLTEHHII